MSTRGEKKTIYDNIKRKCEERGVSVHRMEMESGIGNGVVRRWNEKRPRADGLMKAARYFGCTVDELLKEEVK